MPTRHDGEPERRLGIADVVLSSFRLYRHRPLTFVAAMALGTGTGLAAKTCFEIAFGVEPRG